MMTISDSISISNPLILQPHYYCKNHQKWEISQRLDLETGIPVFHVLDPFGITHAIKEFIVENLEPDVGHAFDQLSTLAEQQRYIHQYLQMRLELATPYQIHVERYHHQWFLRFGDHGLKGGGRIGALVLSTVQVLVGIGLNSTGLGGLAGDTLVTSGISGGMYAIQQNGMNYQEREYAKQTGYGAITGFISSGIAKILGGAGTVRQIGSQVLGAVAGNIASMTACELIEKKQLPYTKTVIKKSIVVIAGAGVGSLTSKAIEYVSKLAAIVGAGAGVSSLTSKEVGYLSKLAKNIEGDVIAILVDALKKGIQSGISSASK